MTVAALRNHRIASSAAGALATTKNLCGNDENKHDSHQCTSCKLLRNRLSEKHAYSSGPVRKGSQPAAPAPQAAAAKAILGCNVPAHQPRCSCTSKQTS